MDRNNDIPKSEIKNNLVNSFIDFLSFVAIMDNGKKIINAQIPLLPVSITE